jgi:hypothetical protein
LLRYSPIPLFKCNKLDNFVKKFSKTIEKDGCCWYTTCKEIPPQYINEWRNTKMKKALALLVVLAVLAIPVFAMANAPAPSASAASAVAPVDILFRGKVADTNYSFYMLPDVAEVDGEDGEVVLPEIVIPAAGSVAAAGVAMILATLGTALLPKK